MADLKTISVNITVVIAVIISLGTTIFNLYDSNSDERYDGLVADIEAVESDHSNAVSILHQRISSLKSELDDLESEYNALKTNVAVYNANIMNLQSDISEIKSDLKSLSETDISTAIKNALRSWNEDRNQ